MTKNEITQQRIYEIALEEKRHHEVRRDDINNQYIALFSGIIAVVPFINNITDVVSDNHEGLVIKLSLSILALIGFALSIIWAANLKRILYFLEILDNIIKNIEKEYGISYTIEIFKQLEEKGSPNRITKYQIMMPRMFMAIFSLIIIFCLVGIGISY